MISAPVLRRADEFGRAFSAARPFRYVAIADFLDPSLCERLAADFPRFEERHALNEMGDAGGKAVRMDVRDLSAAYRELDGYIQSAEFLGFVSRVTGIEDLLYDPDYVGGGTHENRHGQRLDAHVDFNYHPRTRWHRRLNLIVYLNREWDDAWGGALELHANPWRPEVDEVVALAPRFNRGVIFETTEHSWHGFPPIHLPEALRGQASRKSFAIYLYTRERPREQTAPPHATIYVPAAAAATWRAGRVLDEADVGELAQSFARMRTQLRYLYAREQRFGAQIASLEAALDEARAAQRLQLQGYASQPDAPQGLWPDGWAAQTFSVGFVPARPVKGLRLELWSPPQLGTEQQLRVRLAGAGFVQALRPGLRTPVVLPLKAAAGQRVELSIEAERTWRPSADASTGDQRDLAYRIVGAELVH